MTAQPIRSRIRQELLDRILDGHLPPGAPVRHAAVARELGVSVTPLREALIELAGDGFLETRPHRGFIVAPFRTQELADLYGLISDLETAALLETPPGPSRLARLETLNKELADAAGDPWRAVQLDTAWHRELIDDARNEVRKEVLDGLKARAVRYAYAYLRDVGRIPRSVEQHAEIIALLREGDVEGAARELEENWRPRVMLEWVKQHEGRR